MNYFKTLVIGLLVILTACQQIPIKPTKPTLQIQKQIDGGICLSKDNAAKLGEYILELERQ
jgi:hypothetical protein